MPPTLVCFHAHPDDEAIATGGVMARAAADGFRVVLVVATRGEHGEPVDGVLAPDERLWERRVEETIASAKILGVDRVEFLGYRDSGMMGEPSNDHDGSFWSADVDEAAGRLAEILRTVDATVLTVYDANGTYGHPDHIQVHRVGVRAAELADTPRVYEATINRDHVQRIRARASEIGVDDFADDEEIDDQNLGVPESEITTVVDVRPFIQEKRKALAAHASQVSDDHFFLQMPLEAFTEVMGTEWFIRRGASSSLSETSLWDGLDID